MPEPTVSSPRSVFLTLSDENVGIRARCAFVAMCAVKARTGKTPLWHNENIGRLLKAHRSHFKEIWSCCCCFLHPSSSASSSSLKHLLCLHRLVASKPRKWSSARTQICALTCFTYLRTSRWLMSGWRASLLSDGSSAALTSVTLRSFRRCI